MCDDDKFGSLHVVCDDDRFGSLLVHVLCAMMIILEIWKFTQCEGRW